MPSLSADLSVTVPLVALTYVSVVLGCFMGGVSLDYTKRYSFADALNAAASVPVAEAWRHATRSGAPWFLLSSATLWVLLLVFGRRYRPRRIVLIACLIVPYFTSLRGLLVGPFAAVLAPLLTFYLIVGADGEVISEGLLAPIATGWWFLLNTYLLIRTLRSRPLPPHLCGACGYDRRGLPAMAPCPECAAPLTGSTTSVPSGRL